jgi:ketosteroid isomerase-like protein
MKRKSLLLVVYGAFIFFFISCTQISVEEKKEIEIKLITNTIGSCISWFKNKDFDLLFKVVAHDSNYMSVHPGDKVIRGFEQFEKNSEIFKNPDFKYVRHELKDLSINLSRLGDVAWFYCILNDINSYKGQPANWENARWTGVLEKRDRRWVIVQQHFSFAVE